MDSVVSSPDAKPFPLVWKALVWILLYFIIQIAFTIVGIAAASGGDMGALQSLAGDPKAASSLQMVAVGSIWGLVLSGAVTVALILFNLRKAGRKEAIGLYANPALPLVKTLGLGVGLLAIAYALTWVYATYVVPDVALQDAIKKLLGAVPKTPLNWVLIFLAAAVFAPLVEELLFRGYLQTALKRHLGSWSAIALAALIFGVVHMDPYAMPGLILLGGAFGYIYEKTGSLKTNILLHLANNTLALFFM